MERYASILMIAIPLFLLAIVGEKLYGYLKGNDTVPLTDAVSSLFSGISNSTKDVLGLSLTLLPYDWMYRHLSLTRIDEGFWAYLIAFIVIDFQGYWTHRWAHQINFFWNKHAIHHSSEEFNLPCALRQSISSFINLFTFLLLPAAVLGVAPNIIYTLLPIHLFLQFWYHTQHIKRMGWLESFLVTPAHHRVHHAINPEYLDKNHGQIFILWDKWFGTFQEERPDVPPVYGITRPARTWNPIKINFQHLGLLIHDAWRAPRLWDKLRIWFMPTGWRPEGFEQRYPVAKIENVYRFDKYQSSTDKRLLAYALVQLFITLAFVLHFFSGLGKWTPLEIGVYGGFIFLSIYSITELMDLHPKAWIWEFVRLLSCSFWLAYSGWFGLSNGIDAWFVALLFYFALSFLLAYSFNQQLRPRLAATKSSGNWL